jgi:hypothetical protein
VHPDHEGADRLELPGRKLGLAAPSSRSYSRAAAAKSMRRSRGATLDAKKITVKVPNR